MLLKKLIKRLIYLTCDYLYWIKYVFFLIFRNPKVITFIDIDNTLAVTWPSLLYDYKKSETERLKELKVWDGTKQWVIKNVFPSSDIIIYLSARNYQLKRISESWLRKNGFLNCRYKVIHVPTAKDKIKFFKVTSFLCTRLTIIDDLSYNHENDNIKYYENIIRSIKKLNVRYIGYNELIKLNK